MSEPAHEQRVQRRWPQRVSVVAPVHNERDGIEQFVDRTRAVLREYPDWEIVLVDDGSADGSMEELRRLAREDGRIRVIGLARNFGQPIATSAGLEHASGDVVAMIDSDLQDPPEVIGDMVAAWSRGADVVCAVRSERAGETRFKLVTARLFYRWFSRLTGMRLEENAGDFRLLGRPALDAFLAMPERTRFVRGMTTWIGFTQASVRYDRDARPSGSTSYSKGRLLRLAIDAVLSYSFIPLRAASWLGFAISGLAFLLAVLFLLQRVFDLGFVQGFATTNMLLLLLGGIQLIFLGVIGEYLAKIYEEVKQRPLYVVRERMNLPSGQGPIGAVRHAAGERAGAAAGERSAGAESASDYVPASVD